MAGKGCALHHWVHDVVFNVSNQHCDSDSICIDPDLNSSDEHPEFTIADDHHVLNEHDDFESVEDLEMTKDQVSTIIEPVSNATPSTTIISPSAKVFINPLVPQDRWSREKHIELIEPKKLIKALEEEGWIISMQEERNQIERNKNKMDEHEVVVKNKVRLVAQGYNQQEWIDYDGTFSTVARPEAIRIFLAYAAYMGFVVFQKWM
ncbi:retrovirus-related pol polyprotein from transposon TNT 1-94 [Tanacetum coccineum]|uniref:Retrovirus-related pol polyprotein from transposon TNT 1-94 n=1 Tax=Tanacetum coccineum TaxID=301880 RepID=A0ABQ5IHF8_9ASTR